MKIPPPLDAELLERAEFETVRVPELLKAPPLPVTCAPKTVTPEIERMPPVAMLKILKSPLLPLMVSEEALRPVIVMLPEVPPVTEEVELTMVGRAEARVMV